MNWEDFMNLTSFECEKCGTCCTSKYPCIYSSERSKAQRLAKEQNKKLILVPFRFKLDLTNEQVIVIIYRFKTKPCLFLENGICSIQENKFIACRKYPIASWLDLGFLSLLGFRQTYYEWDVTCTFLKNNKELLKQWKRGLIEKKFSAELQASKEDRNSWLSLEKKIRKIIKRNNINIISDLKLKKRKPHQYKKYLTSWKNLPIEEYIEKYGM